MTLQAQIEARLLEALAPDRMQLVNESHQHSGPGAETHFNLIIVAEAFAGQNRVQRQRAVFRADICIHRVGSCQTASTSFWARR